MHTALSDESLLVVVADDDPDMLAFVSATLRADGCSTLEAADGEELLELLDQGMDDPRVRPDVLVADVKMPRLSGLGVLQALKKAGWNLPVVMMTVVSDESIHTVARRLGAVGVLNKPFDADDLLTAVRNARTARDHQH